MSEEPKMTKQEQFLWIVQTTVLANGINISTQPERIDKWRHEFSGVGAKTYWPMRYMRASAFRLIFRRPRPLTNSACICCTVSSKIMRKSVQNCLSGLLATANLTSPSSSTELRAAPPWAARPISTPPLDSRNGLSRPGARRTRRQGSQAPRRRGLGCAQSAAAVSPERSAAPCVRCIAVQTTRARGYR